MFGILRSYQLYMIRLLYRFTIAASSKFKQFFVVYLVFDENPEEFLVARNVYNSSQKVEGKLFQFRVERHFLQ